MTASALPIQEASMLYAFERGLSISLNCINLPVRGLSTWSRRSHIIKTCEIHVQITQGSLLTLEKRLTV